jgi:tyrosinase
MNVELQINDSPDPKARYVSWAPAPCRIRVTNPSGVSAPTVNVQISGKSANGGGEVVFRGGATGQFSSALTVPVPVDGASVQFFVAGKFGRPSVNDGDVTIEASVRGSIVGSVPVMVRIRKNANTLTPNERDRFVSALARLNNQGTGRFSDFRDMHEGLGLAQAHNAPGFLPWHRAYLLDLERELQALDPSVTIPYWRFNQAAPNIFRPDFLGATGAGGNVQFSAANPLRFWKTDGVLGIIRRPIPGFNLNAAPPGLRTEARTLDLGDRYQEFREQMEDNPHDRAHTRFTFIPPSMISDPETAPKDPLFFLLHCNVDRLWAKWQRQELLFNPALAASYDRRPSRPGHNLSDTMWPWNGVTGGTRPPTAPGGPMATSPGVSGPGLQPRVQDLLDYQGVVSATSRMGYDYDDVPLA